MGELKPPAFYDQTFRTSPNYRGPWEQSTFAPLWCAIRDLVREKGPAYPRIVDLGCGAGQVLDALLDGNIRPSHYLGIDWSREAITLCRQRAIQRPYAEFWCASLRGYAGYGGPDILEAVDVVVACEVLEHLVEGDIPRLADSLSLDALWVISLPTKDSEAHLRHFPEAEQAHEWLEQWFKIASYEFTPTGHHLFTARVK